MAATTKAQLVTQVKRLRNSLGHAKSKHAALDRSLAEALEQQAATSEILRVIRSSPTDVQPVFEAIARKALALCGSSFANVFRYDGELMHYAASHLVSPEQIEIVKQGYPAPPSRGRVAGRAILSRAVVCIEDALADPDYDHPVAPIIALTSFALSGDGERAKQAGATAYLAKPYSPFDLLTLIRKLLPEG